LGIWFIKIDWCFFKELDHLGKDMTKEARRKGTNLKRMKENQWVVNTSDHESGMVRLCVFHF
jgi:hypothetical protein